MPQHKHQIPSIGGALFESDLVSFSRRWIGDHQIHRSALSTIGVIAAAPDKFAIPFAVNLAKLYHNCPDFTAEALAFVRRKWRRLAKTKTGRLKIFLATTTNMDCRAWKNARPKVRSQWDLTDGEIAKAFENMCGEDVTKDDVVKARKFIARKISGNRKNDTAFQDGWLIRGGKNR